MKIISNFNLMRCPETGHFNPVPVEGAGGTYSPVPPWEEVSGGWSRHWGEVVLNGATCPIHDYVPHPGWEEEEDEYEGWLEDEIEYQNSICEFQYGPDCWTPESWKMVMMDDIPF